ncbi:hypothetical protein TNCV_1176611 [Trichonephila clavipes]|nr:hypothetical protein TNCV_1176611 [Trichonephila clavipes]
MNRIRKTPGGLDCPIVLSEEIIAEMMIMSIQRNYSWNIWELAQSAKNIIDTDSGDECRMNNAASVPTSSEMRNVI